MKTQKLFLNEFVLKVIALLTMTLSHIGFMLASQGYYLEGTNGYNAGIILQYIGRLSFPLFAFMLAEGLHKTKNRENYIIRLASMGLLILAAQTILYAIDRENAGTLEGNAFLDLTLGALFVYLLENSKKPLRILALLPLCYVVLCYAMDISEIYATQNGMTSIWSAGYPLFLRASYSLFGFVLILLFYYAKPWSVKMIRLLASGEEVFKSVATEEKIQGFSDSMSAVFLVLVNLLFWTFAKCGLPDPYFMGAQSYSALSALFILFYNGKRGYDKKWFRIFSYLYYPVHLVLIWGIFALCFR